MQGYHTKSRQRILEFLKEHCNHTVSAADIHKALKNSGTAVNLATIYRNLDKMTESGILMKYLDNNADRAVYQYTGEQEHCHEHLHMQCIKCGEIIHLNCSFMAEITKHLIEHYQFELQCTNSILYGMCNECRNSSS